MAMVEDLSVFFNPAEFAVTATRNGSVPVNGIFDAAYSGAFGDVVGGTEPVFTCALGDVDQGDTLAVGGTAYRVRAVELEGMGIVLARLEKQ